MNYLMVAVLGVVQGVVQRLPPVGDFHKLPAGFFHPHPDILRRYRELGGEIITVGADGHRPEHIAYDFEKADSILKSCGFRYYTEFKERKPVFKLLT